MTVDGFVAGPEGQLDWIWIKGKTDDPEAGRRIIELADSCDTILLGRKMAAGFTDYWENVLDNEPNSPFYDISKRMVNMRKIVFSHTQTTIEGRNIEVENSDLATAVQALKQQPGKDIIVYGGASFASALISLNLVDEYYLFINPVAIGKGLSIFKEQKILKLDGSTSFANGKVLNKYLP